MRLSFESLQRPKALPTQKSLILGSCREYIPFAKKKTVKALALPRNKETGILNREGYIPSNNILGKKKSAFQKKEKNKNIVDEIVIRHNPSKSTKTLNPEDKEIQPVVIPHPVVFSTDQKLDSLATSLRPRIPQHCLSRGQSLP